MAHARYFESSRLQYKLQYHWVEVSEYNFLKNLIKELTLCLLRVNHICLWHCCFYDKVVSAFKQSHNFIFLRRQIVENLHERGCRQISNIGFSFVNKMFFSGTILCLGTKNEFFAWIWEYRHFLDLILSQDHLCHYQF